MVQSRSWAISAHAFMIRLHAYGTSFSCTETTNWPSKEQRDPSRFEYPPECGKIRKSTDPPRLSSMRTLAGIPFLSPFQRLAATTAEHIGLLLDRDMKLMSIIGYEGIRLPAARRWFRVGSRVAGGLGLRKGGGVCVCRPPMPRRSGFVLRQTPFMHRDHNLTPKGQCGSSRFRILARVWYHPYNTPATPLTEAHLWRVAFFGAELRPELLAISQS